MILGLLCALYVPFICHLCAFYVPLMCLLCAFYVPCMCLLCAFYVPCMCLVCALYVPFVPSAGHVGPCFCIFPRRPTTRRYHNGRARGSYNRTQRRALTTQMLNPTSVNIGISGSVVGQFRGHGGHVGGELWALILGLLCALYVPLMCNLCAMYVPMLHYVPFYVPMCLLCAYVGL